MEGGWQNGNFQAAVYVKNFRQMKDLVLDNSLQRNPFPVVFVNYRSTINVADEVVK